MKKFLLLYYLLLSMTMVGIGQNSGFSGKPIEIVESDGINIPVYDFNGFSSNLSRWNDTIYVINFWATWCKPCIEELPAFMKVSEEFIHHNVVFIYVSLDFRKNLITNVIPFLKARNMSSNVILLNDPDANNWIDKIDPNWSGSLPATLIYRNDQRIFKESALSYEALKSIINTFKIQ